MDTYGCLIRLLTVGTYESYEFLVHRIPTERHSKKPTVRI